MEMLALAGAGFHVVWANPRGSTGYGEEFARVIDGAWGDADASDLLLMVDRVVRMGLTDRRRVGVLLGHFPGRVAAGVSENPVTDLISEFGNSDFGTDTGKSATSRALPSDSFGDRLERSPYTKIYLKRGAVAALAL
jgi:dipeptidyl aminopeptidase/acylaminoacyl peptidase